MLCWVFHENQLSPVNGVIEAKATATTGEKNSTTGAPAVGLIENSQNGNDSQINKANALNATSLNIDKRKKTNSLKHRIVAKGK